jgi:hypothetical protein
MHLYSMHKRDVFLALCGFVCSFILLLFIGLAGPNVTQLHSISASHILSSSHHLNRTQFEHLLHNGPFRLHSPTVSSYDDHLRLWITVRLQGKTSVATTTAAVQDNADADIDTFQKTFRTWLRVTVRQSKQPEAINRSILNQFDVDRNNVSGSSHNLHCDANRCDPVLLLSLEQLDHSQYTIQLSFNQLLNSLQSPSIRDIEFTFTTLNAPFANLSIWFRLLCLLSCLVISVRLAQSTLTV